MSWSFAVVFAMALMVDQLVGLVKMSVFFARE